MDYYTVHLTVHLRKPRFGVRTILVAVLFVACCLAVYRSMHRTMPVIGEAIITNEGAKTILELRGQKTVLDALSAAGPINRLSNKSIVVQRGERQLAVDYVGITRDAAVETNHLLRPGDRVVISQRGLEGESEDPLNESDQADRDSE